MPKIHTKNGFEYYAENNMGQWAWYYRPCGRIPFMEFAPSIAHNYRKVKKIDMEALLNDAAPALVLYQSDLNRLSDVVQAKADYEKAKANYEDTLQPGWEDDFRGNNPGKIGRKTKEIEWNFKCAGWRLNAAIALQEQLKLEKNAFAD